MLNSRVFFNLTLLAITAALAGTPSKAWAFGAAPPWLAAPIQDLTPEAPIRRTADQCTSVDLRDAHPVVSAYFHRPQNQGFAGYCYAFTAAELLTFQMGIPVSAADIGITFDALNNAQEMGQSGEVPLALKQTEEGGACPESVLPSEAPGTLLGRDATFGGLVNCANRLRRGDLQLDAIVKAGNRMGTPEWYCLKEAEFFFPTYDPRKTFSEIASATGAAEWMHGYAESTCGGHRISVPSSIRFDLLSRNLLDQIDEQLVNRANIVGIAYHPATILKAADKSTHASVVMGRQWIDGQCRYLVKNTWGSDCSQYTSDIRCVASEGAYWITDERLHDILIEAYVSH